MILDRAAAYAADRAAILPLLRDLAPEEWTKPSRCDGWTVKDVVSHMAAACHGTFTVWVVKLIAGKDIEAGNDRDATKRESWEPAKVLAEYETWSGRLAPVQSLLQKPGVRSLPIRVAEVGTYPAKLLTSAFVFDHGLHVRYDIADALGRPVPTPDANRTAVSTEWMLAGLPTMSAGTLSWLDRTVALNLVGEGGGSWAVTGGNGKRVTVTAGAPANPGVTIEGDVATFPLWGTGRRPWREAGVGVKGDEELGTRFLDTMRII